MEAKVLKIRPQGSQRRVAHRLKREPRYGVTFIRAWRKFRGLTLERLASRVGTTHASLSRVERGKQPYNQELLEKLADALTTEPSSLLIRDPADPEGIWTIWDKASVAERKMIVDIAKTVLKTGT